MDHKQVGCTALAHHCPLPMHVVRTSSCSSHPVPATNRRVDLHRVPRHDLGAERERGSLAAVRQRCIRSQGQWGLVERKGHVPARHGEAYDSCIKTFELCTVVPYSLLGARAHEYPASTAHR